MSLANGGLPRFPFAMPAQHGVGLDDLQRRFPRAQPAGQKDDDGAIAPGQSWSLGLPFENDYLMAQQRVFEQQFWLGAGHIQGHIQGQGMVVRLCPPAKG